MSDAPKSIVITGASGGIGAELARTLAKRGHRLALAARRLDALDAIARDAESSGSPRAIAVATDATRRTDIEHLRDEAIARLGGFDVWVNNAGRGISRSVLELTDDDVDEMIAVNLKSALYGMQVAAAHFMERGRGQIINVSSMLARAPVASFRSVYSASKAALNSLTANLRADLASSHPGIVVSLVMPGLVSTEFASNARGFTSGTTPFVRAAGQPRVQTAEEVAEAIAGVIAEPREELYTNPDSRGFVETYRRRAEG
jgi:short-subunit dehydrogenase